MLRDEFDRHRGGRLLAGLGLVAQAATACWQGPASLTDCRPADGVTPICGFQNPEDLAILPGGAWVAISQLPGSEGEPGSLVAFRNSDDRQRELFPPPEDLGIDLNSSQPVEGWGDTACPGPPDRSAFSPHGIDVRSIAGGSPRLAAVNHGGREAIELFEVVYALGGPALGWRGCVPLPEGVLANDVAILGDGGLVTTHQMATLGGFESAVDLVRLFTGGDTGDVLVWRSETGWASVPGSNGAFPNGIAVSEDGREIYFSEWSQKRLVRLRLDASGDRRRTSIDLPHHPDNLSWTRDGRLLVTGQLGPLGEVIACGQIKSGTCALAFSVLRVEPSTLESELILDHAATSMGAGTSALQVGNEILIGTFAGDRIARAAYSY